MLFVSVWEIQSRVLKSDRFITGSKWICFLLPAVQVVITNLPQVKRVTVLSFVLCNSIGTSFFPPLIITFRQLTHNISGNYLHLGLYLPPPNPYTLRPRNVERKLDLQSPAVATLRPQTPSSPSPSATPSSHPLNNNNNLLDKCSSGNQRQRGPLRPDPLHRRIPHNRRPTNRISAHAVLLRQECDRTQVSAREEATLGLDGEAAARRLVLLPRLRVNRVPYPHGFWDYP